MVIDIIVPEQSLHKNQRCISQTIPETPRSPVTITHSNPETTKTTYLVTIAPEVVLGPDVLVCVLGLLALRRLVRLVLPVLRPELVSVYARDAEGRDDDAAPVSAPSLIAPANRRCCCRDWCAGQLKPGTGRDENILDGQFPPQICHVSSSCRTLLLSLGPQLRSA